MLVQRILTALAGIPIVFLCIYYGGISFFLMFFLIILFAVWEYFSICKKYNPLNILGTVIACLFYLSLYFNFYTREFIILSILLIFLVLMIKNKITNISGSISVTCFGTLFIPWTLYHMVLIRDIPDDGIKYIVFLFVNIWLLDTGAYFVGKKFGKYKLAKNISPKKTIEGAVAGVITSIIVSLLCRIVFMKDIISLNEAILFAVVISAVGQFSDLAESMFKRDADIKDSGNILPGHGGMLDRFDSYLFAAPVFYYLIVLLKNFS